jgi:hypothetical protein
MKIKKSTGLLFILSDKVEKPFNSLNNILKSNFKADYNVFELPYYRFIKNYNNLTFKYYQNNKTKKLVIQKKISGISFFSITYQFIFQFFFGIKFFKNFFSRKFDKIIIISHGLKCFLLSFILKKIYNNKIILITFLGDRITENFNYFGTNFFFKVLNKFFSKTQYFVKNMSLSSDLLIYESKKLLEHDKKLFKKKLNYYLIQNSLINYDDFIIQNNNKKFKKNILFIGNFIDQGHLKYIKKLSNQLNNKFYFHIIGTCSKEFLNIHKNHKNFRIYGYIKDLNKVKKIIKKCSFGTAFYNIDNKERKLIPSGKINFYLQNSIPILASSYAFESKQINNYKIGISSNDINLVANFIKKNSSNKKYNLILKNLIKFNKLRKYDENLLKFLQDIKALYC